MDFVRGLSMSKRGHEVDMYMCNLIPCNKQVIVEKTAHPFFHHVRVHFGLPTSLWIMMDTKFKKTIVFHPNTYTHTNMVDMTVVQDCAAKKEMKENPISLFRYSSRYTRKFKRTRKKLSLIQVNYGGLRSGK